MTHDDPIVTGKIALAHLNEFPDYYTRFARMEAEAEKDFELAGAIRLGRGGAISTAGRKTTTPCRGVARP